MADDGVFPVFFRSGPTSISRTVLLQTSIAVGLVFITDLQGLLGYLSTTLALSSAVTVATLLLPEKPVELLSADKRLPAPFATLCAATFCVATLLIAALMIWHDKRDMIVTTVTILVGTILWMLTSASQCKSAHGIEK